MISTLIEDIYFPFYKLSSLLDVFLLLVYTWVGIAKFKTILLNGPSSESGFKTEICVLFATYGVVIFEFIPVSLGGIRY